MIRGGSTARPKLPRPRTPPVRNTFVSEIGQPLFAGVDLDSHLERFVLDAVDGELPESIGPVTPPPAPTRTQTPRPPPLKLRAPTPPRVAPVNLLPNLEASVPAPTGVQVTRETKPTPQPAGGVGESSKPEPVEPVVARDPGPFGGDVIPSAADLGAIIEASLSEEPEPVAPHSSEAGRMTVDALPVGAAQVTQPRTSSVDGTELLERLRARLQRVPRSAWEAGAAALLGGVIGYQASSLLMWLVG